MKKRNPWIQLDADFPQSALAKILVSHDRENRWRFIHLICLARRANQQGRLVSVVGKRELAWTISMLASDNDADSPEAYGAFLQILLEVEVIHQDADGVFVLSDWEQWWGSLAKSGAERQAALRERQAEECDEDADSDSSSPGHDVSRQSDDDVTEKRHSPVTKEPRCDDDVTPMSRNPALQNRTEHYTTENNNTCTQREQNQTTTCAADSANVNGLVSFEIHKSIPEHLDEDQFWTLMPHLYESHLGKKWTISDRRKLEGGLKQKWAGRHPDWAVRYLALKFACRFVYDELRRLENGQRIEPIDSPWGLAVSMAAKYSDESADEIERMRRERSEGRDPRRPRYRRIEYATR